MLGFDLPKELVVNKALKDQEVQIPEQHNTSSFECLEKNES